MRSLLLVLAIVALLVFLIAAVTGYLYPEMAPFNFSAPRARVESCPSSYTDQAVSCYVAFTQHSIKNISSDLDWWTRYLNICVFGGVAFGIISTVVIAVQGDTKNNLIKSVGIISTVLATSLNTFMTTFHVHDNIDKLIEVRGKMTLLINNLQHDVSNEPDLKKRGEILFAFTNQHQALVDEAYKVKGSAGRLHEKAKTD